MHAQSIKYYCFYSFFYTPSCLISNGRTAFTFNTGANTATTISIKTTTPTTIITTTNTFATICNCDYLLKENESSMCFYSLYNFI